MTPATSDPRSSHPDPFVRHLLKGTYPADEWAEEGPSFRAAAVELAEFLSDDFRHTRTVQDIVRYGRRRRLARAARLLIAELSGGPRWADELYRLARDRGISESTLRRAARDLDVVRRRSGNGREHRSTWELPASPPKPEPEDPLLELLDITRPVTPGLIARIRAYRRPKLSF